MFGIATKIRHLMTPVVMSRLFHPARRHKYLRTLGMKGIGKSFIGDRCVFQGLGTVIGDDTFINTGVHFDDSARVTLGSHVFVGPGAMFLTGTHPIGPSTQRAGDSTHAPIVVEDGCWIGARATILPGVTVKRGCVVGAGAVVTKDCESDGLYLGVPARRIRDL